MSEIGISESRVSVARRNRDPNKAFIMIPRSMKIRWWYFKRRKAQDEFMAELTAAMMVPLDLDEPNTSCFQ